MFTEIFFLVFFTCCESFAANLPPEIQKCKLGTPDFEECMKKSIDFAGHFFKNGSAEFGLPRIDPFFVDKMEIQGDPSKSVRLNQKFENVALTGLLDSKIKYFKYIPDEGKCVWELDVFTPATHMIADFEMTGQILLFPINGHGKCTVDLFNVTNEHRAQCEHYSKKGKTFLRLKNYSMKMHVGNCRFVFPNLMPGNEQISKEIQKVIDENSLEIFNDVKSGFEKLLSSLHERASNGMFSRVPEDELFLM
ncbi:uncharacterized protein LOC132706295 [Cylas formicarius]|uniref:uncharacterized protein LOC132706295 n=1 Tax=Cylas formicarius TaxID=197179 RepID=UPI0029583CDC|nr:uncharacterized protein LOC132706295 [Cylas formicarius]